MTATDQIDDSAIARSIEVETVDLTLRGLEWGRPTDAERVQTKPRVLALHGWLDNAGSFSRLAPLLHNAHVVALDLPGHGHSEHYPAGQMYDVFSYVVKILEAADELGWDDFTVMGHSLGTVIFTLLASAAPERIDKVIFLDGLGPLHEEASLASRRLQDALREYFQLRQHPKVKIYKNFEAMIRVRMRANGLSYGAAKCIVERGVKTVMCVDSTTLASDRRESGYSWRFDPRLMLPSMHRLTEEQVLSHLTAITAPLCLIRAEDSFLKDYPGMATRINAVQHLESHMLPGHHHFHLEEPTSIAEIVNAFLV